MLWKIMLTIILTIWEQISLSSVPGFPMYGRNLSITSGEAGLLSFFGGCKAGTSVAFDTHRIHYDEITVKGSFHFTPFDVRYAYDLLTENILNVTPLISGSDDLKNIISVFQDLKNGIGIKYSIRP